MSQPSSSDWREPLYQCALSHKKPGPAQRPDLAVREFAFLGSYRDSRELYSVCCAERDALISTALTSKNPRRSLLAINTLRACTQLDNYDELCASFQKRKETFLKTAARRRKIKRLFLIGIAAAAIVLIAALLIYRNNVLQPAQWETAQQLIEEENYEDAIGICRSLLLGSYGSEAEEQLPRLHHLLGEQRRKAGDYAGAIEAFETFAEEDEIRATRIAWADALAAEGLWFDAAEQMTLSGDQARIQQLYTDWALDAEERGEYQEALDALARAQKQAKLMNAASANAAENDNQTFREELLARLREERLADTMQKVFPADGTVNQDLAAELGTQLDDLSSILTFCRALTDHDVDPGTLFVNGIVVNNISLAQYQTVNSGLSTDLLLSLTDHSKVLVFSRTIPVSDLEKRNNTYIQSDHAYETPDKLTESNHTAEIRFLPGETYALPKEYWPETPQECTTLLLADCYYLRSGIVQIDRKIKSAGQSYTTKSYSCVYEAVNSVTIYNVASSTQCYTVDYKKITPDAGQPAELLLLPDAFNLPEFSPIIHTLTYSSELYKQLWGTSDSVFLKDALRKGATFFEN